MSRKHQYHQPNAPDPGGESGSDTDENYGRSGPAAESRRYRNYDRSTKTWGKEAQEQMEIPLQNIRLGNLGGFPRRGRRQRLRDSQKDEEGEDLSELLQDSPDPRYSRGGQRTSSDDAPLLQPDNELANGAYNAKSGENPSLFRFQIPSFISDKTRSRRLGQEKLQDCGTSRNISIGQYPPPSFPPNAVSNAKYTAWSFLPRTLYNEFSFFFNMYFLLVALSQIIPPLRIGFLSTYIAPLVFVLTITLGKEALDDIARRRRDIEANKEAYTVLWLRNVSGRRNTKSNGKHGKRVRFGRMEKSVANGSSRLDAVHEEEETVGVPHHPISNIEVKEIKIKSRDLKVGDVVKLGKDQRIPADLVILKSYANEAVDAKATSPIHRSEEQTQRDLLAEPVSEPPIADTAMAEADAKESTSADYATPAADAGGSGETFIRTDQLDGETDWKLRLASPMTQVLDPRLFVRLKIVAGKPEKKVNEFVGTVEYHPIPVNMLQPQYPPISARTEGDNMIKSAPLTIDNTAWANTVLASNATILAVVVYTGAQTRQALSTSTPRSKAGLLEYEINNLTKILCALTLTLSIVLVALRQVENPEGRKWYVTITRFLILFSTIIPISLRVNLDMGKTVYAWLIERDEGMPGAVVRTSTIPEDLGRIEYLLSDKTGTLTQNGRPSRC